MTRSIVLTLIVGLFLFGCGKKKEENTGLDGTRQARATTDGDVGALSFDGASAVGVIGLSDNQEGFSENLSAFLSASMNPDDVGFVSAMGRSDENTGVRFEGALAFPSSVCQLTEGTSQILSDQSNLKIKIYDDMVGTEGSDGNPLDFIKIDFDQATAGEVQVAGGQIVFEVHFRDQYGEIVLQGQLTNGNKEVSGFVWFRNFRHYLGEAPTPSQMTVLGRFVTTASGFIGCQ